MYAIVRCGGRQEKASVDDVLTVDRLTGEVGSALTFPAVLVVDGDTVVTDPEELGGYQVAAEIVGEALGPKISVIRYKNKTGYRRRLGHRQHYTQVKITGITKGGAESKSGTAGKTPKPAASSAAAGKTPKPAAADRAPKPAAAESVSKPAAADRAPKPASPAGKPAAKTPESTKES